MHTSKTEQDTIPHIHTNWALTQRKRSSEQYLLTFQAALHARTQHQQQRHHDCNYNDQQYNSDIPNDIPLPLLLSLAFSRVYIGVQYLSLASSLVPVMKSQTKDQQPRHPGSRFAATAGAGSLDVIANPVRVSGQLG